MNGSFADGGDNNRKVCAFTVCIWLYLVAHLIVYALGIPVFRTLAFTVGFLAQAVLALAIFRVF